MGIEFDFDLNYFDNLLVYMFYHYNILVVFNNLMSKESKNINDDYIKYVKFFL